MENHSERIEELQIKNSKYQRELKNHRSEVSDLRTKLEKAESKVYTCKFLPFNSQKYRLILVTNEIADNRKNANEAMANLQRLFGGKKPF